MNISIDVWNANQLANKVLNLPPIDCQCKECEPEHTFQCSVCKRLRAYCWGSADNFYGLCDDCWSDKHREDKKEAIA